MQRLPTTVTAESSRVTAVIVAYKSKEVIGACVRSLLADPVVGEVVVIDNAACQETAIALPDSSQVRYVPSPYNLGFGPAVNSIHTEINTQFVAVVNPDTVTRPGTVGQCVRFLNEGDRRGLMSPRIFTNGELVRSSEREVTLVRLCCTAIGRFPRHQLQRAPDDHARAHRTAAVNGAFLVARTRALDDAGWFDDDTFLFGEEQDLCRRIRARHWEVWYAPLGSVFHRDQHSTEQLPKAYIDGLLRHARASQLRRYRGPAEAGLYRLTAGAAYWLRKLFRKVAAHPRKGSQ